MIRRTLGRTGIEVSALALGAGPLGDEALSDVDAERLVRTAVELGIDTFDTAPSYGRSEERLGRALRGARGLVTLVTKGGYGVPGVADWTPECIALGIDAALARLGVETIDVFLLHSCGLDRLSRGDLFEPLLRARDAGKVRAIGYSGDGEALAWAVRASVVDVVECSINLVDQRALAIDVPDAHERGVGVLAKRGMANAPWRTAQRPKRGDAATYWDRFQTMRRALESDDPWDDTAVRFAAFASGVASVLVGTTRVPHLERAAACIARGDLGAERRRAIEAAFARHGGEAGEASWAGIV